MSAEKPPWWGIPAVTAAATLLGAFVAYTSTRASDNRKTKNEDRRRWDEEVRTHAVKYLKFMDSYMEKTKEHKKFSGFNAATYKMVTHPKTGEQMKDFELARLQKNKAKVKAQEALDQLSSIAPRRLYQRCLGLFVSVLSMEMEDKVTTELEDHFKSRRRLVRAELRRAMKVEPLPTKASLKSRIKRRVKNPRSFATDYEKWQDQRAKIKELKQAKQKRA